ncbi:MAG: RluA family pseudouridine synthase [Oligoflexia bacterium]|nr:RluA family pseudouridine synthase [Oligoflexia bacterium]
MNTKKIIFKKEFKEKSPTTIADFLASESGLSKSIIKKTMLQGAVWFRDAKKQLAKSRSLTRVRRATKELKQNDYLEMYYDANILKDSIDDPKPIAIFECEHYGVWFKPAGVLSQGTKFGDHLSILRWVETNRQTHARNQNHSDVYLIHRLDLEVEGIMIIAYTKRAAALLCELFKKHQIKKEYLAVVVGDVSFSETTIENKLDGLYAKTICKCLSKITVDSDSAKYSLLSINISTGRYHQIRRHLKEIGHPVLGDQRYGHSHKSGKLHLKARCLEFKCPLTGIDRKFFYEIDTWSMKFS